MQHRSPTNYQAVDISSNNPNIDFTALKAAGYDIVYIKATQGISYINPQKENQYAGARINGLKVGFYHWFEPGDDPEQQALWFLSVLQGYTYDCILALDVEDAGGLNSQDLSVAVHACLNEIAYLSGQEAMIYTYTSFIQNLKAIFVGQYPLWIADYNGKDTPGDNLIWKTWAGFQYSEVGNIGGISPLDLDEFTSTVFIKEGPLMDVTAALTILKEAGIITEPTYWSNLAQYVKYLDELLINMAQKLEVGK